MSDRGSTRPTGVPRNVGTVTEKQRVMVRPYSDPRSEDGISLRSPQMVLVMCLGDVPAAGCVGPRGTAALRLTGDGALPTLDVSDRDCSHSSYTCDVKISRRCTTERKVQMADSVLENYGNQVSFFCGASQHSYPVFALVTSNPALLLVLLVH